ncbi:MAG: hypothetical protein IKO80_05220 [Lachnospiraceae bacterium]|nr:hypothetical protein [Lachnospiraceae bacterium]
MRKMVFKMERTGLLTEGEEVSLSEGMLPGACYYTLDSAREKSLAMSGNIPFTERLTVQKGTVEKIEENERGFYVTVCIDEAGTDAG